MTDMMTAVSFTQHQQATTKQRHTDADTTQNGIW